MTRAWPVALATALAAVVVLTGCSGTGESGDANPSTQGAQSAPSTPGATGTDEAADGDAVASVTFPSVQSGSDVTARIHGLERRDDLLVLTATITRSETTGEGQGGPASLRMLFGAPFSPTLIDPDALVRYRVVETDEGPVSTDGFTTMQGIEPGDGVELYAVFAAPPTDVGHLDVQLYPQMPTLTAVPIR